MEDLLQFTNEDISGGILDESLDEVFSAEFTEGLTELRLDSQGSLCVPNDDLSEFDWLSSFDLKASGGGSPSHPGIAIPQLGSESCGYDPQRQESKHCPADPYQCFDSLSRSPTSVLDPNNFKHSEESCHGSFPAKPRSKRSRGISRAWSSNLLSELNHAAPLPALYPDNSSGNDVWSELASSDFSPCNSLSESGDSTAFNLDLASVADSAGRKLSVKFSGIKACSKSDKKMRKKRLSENPLVRRCNHCSTTKTPQWRAGPDGPKTLCNACGVRYKSGRLLPEYRPAGSPGYVFSKHSNSHRKILEMRRMQEMKLVEERRGGSLPADRAHSSPSHPVASAEEDAQCDVNMTELTN